MAGATDTGEVVDPICGEIFPPELAVFKTSLADGTVYFCSKTCKEEYDAAHAPSHEQSA